MASRLELIQRTLHTLKPGELDTFRKYLTGFKGNSGSGANKSEQLLNLILKEKSLDEEKIQKKLKIDNSGKAFTKLCSRFREKLHESILLDANLNREGAYEAHSKEKNRVRKQLILVEILVTRGLWEDAIKILKNVVTSCEQYELYNILSDALLLKYKLDLRYQSPATAEKTALELQSCEANRLLSNKSDLLFYKIGFIRQQKSNKEIHTREIENYISELEAEPLLESNGPALYNFLNMRLQLAEYKDEFENIIKLSDQLVQLIEKHKSLQQKIKYANSYGYGMIAAIKSAKFEKAEEYVELSKKYVYPGSLNYLSLQEHEFFTYFYSKNYDKANKLVKDMIGIAEEKNLSHFYNKYRYFHACIMMKEGKYEEANRTMLQVDELDNDKEGWNIGIRLFYIINRLEKKLYDAADTQIENLRKYFENTMKHKALRKRDVTILRILMKLEHHNYDFVEVYNRYQKLFELINTQHHDYKWLMLSHELIPFHQWFVQMVDEQKKSREKVLA